MYYGNFGPSASDQKITETSSRTTKVLIPPELQLQSKKLVLKLDYYK
jgi:hypothetical protein